MRNTSCNDKVYKMYGTDTSDSVKAAAKYGAVVAGMMATDAMLVSGSGENISERKIAPDNFRLQLFPDMLNALTEGHKADIAGTSQICTLNGHEMYMIKGGPPNFKITANILKTSGLLMWNSIQITETFRYNVYVGLKVSSPAEFQHLKNTAPFRGKS